MRRRYRYWTGKTLGMLINCRDSCEGDVGTMGILLDGRHLPKVLSQFGFILSLLRSSHPLLCVV